MLLTKGVPPGLWSRVCCDSLSRSQVCVGTDHLTINSGPALSRFCCFDSNIVSLPLGCLPEQFPEELCCVDN